MSRVLKAGRDTGSLMNHVYSRTVVEGAEIKPGTGVTILLWTDRHAGTIESVSPSGKTITVREDTATRTDANGMSESQTYRFEPNPNGVLRTFRKQKDGGFREKNKGAGLLIGARDEYYDFSF